MDKKQPGAIIMAAGGALMAVGAVLTWLTLTFDVSVFTDAIKQQTGVDISGTPGFSSLSQPTSIAGTKGWEGKLALVGGLVALIIGVLALLGVVKGVIASRSAFVGGALGVFGAGYVLLTKAHELSKGVGDAKVSLAPALSSLGLSAGVLDNVFKISTGIGVYVAIVGGVVAIVGGIMLMGKGAAAPAAMGMGEPMAAPPVGSSMFGGPAAPAPPMSPPAAPAPAETAPTPQITQEPPTV